jgi:DNA-binding transcriptional MerR regulator
MDIPLPAIPAKRYFTIGEVSDLCGVKPYVLRYWEQEFTQLKPMKRRGNRRYYQHHEVLLIRRIRDLLYDQGFTISGARNKLGDLVVGDRPGAAAEFHAEAQLAAAEEAAEALDSVDEEDEERHAAMALRAPGAATSLPLPITGLGAATLEQVRAELLAIRSTLLG